MGVVPVIPAVLAVWLCLPWPGSAAMQTPAPPARDTSRIESAVAEARELAASDITAAQEKLRLLLAELRGWRESGTMQADGGRLYQEALLLHIGIQTKLLAPEEEILGSFRELLLVNPAIDPAAFNPRERLLLERSRIGQTGHLSLKTDLPDVAISYLGTELGRTPLDLPLLAGKYRLVLSRPTYTDQEFDAEIRAGEILIMERTMRRSTVSVPLSVPVPGIRLKLNGREVGLTLGFEPWLASLPGDVRERLGEIVRGWRVDTRTDGFFRLTEVPVGEPLQLDLEGPCYEPLNIQWTVSEQEVDWTRSFVVAPELRAIAMTREVGFLEVASAPEGAEVWLDGRLEGRTPMGMDVCAGTHRVQVLHPAGQFTREVVLRKGQVSKVSGELKPALAFLGIYGRPASGGGWNLLDAESQIVVRKLALKTTAFAYSQLIPSETEALRRSGDLNFDAVIQALSEPAQAEDWVRRVASQAGKVNLLLFGLRMDSGYHLWLSGTIRPAPDRISLPTLEEPDLDFFIERLNRAAQAVDRIRTPHLGIDFLDAPGGLTVRRIHPSAKAGLAGLVEGSLIRSVDRSPMSLRELGAYLRGLQPGRSVLLEPAVGSGAGRAVNAPVQYSGMEYPWSFPGSYPNAVMTMLHHWSEMDADSDTGRYARLSLALGLMRQGEPKRASALLSRISFDSGQRGVSQGTVLYYQGRCAEELGDRSGAETFYSRAKDFAGATLGTPYGVSIPELCEWRLRLLRNTPP